MQSLHSLSSSSHALVMLVCVRVMQKYAINACVRVCDAEICN